MENNIIKTIESRSKEEVINLLKANHIGFNKRNKFKDYSIAKKLIFQGRFINTDIYDIQIGWIIKYLGL